MAYGPGRRDHDRHIDLIGYAPDLDMDIPGACSVMDGVMPTPRGWRATPNLDRSSAATGVMTWSSTAGYTGTVQSIFYEPSYSESLYVISTGGFYRHSIGATLVPDNITGAVAFSTDRVDVAVLGADLIVATGYTLANSNSYLVGAGTLAYMAGAPKGYHVVAANRFMLSFRDGDVAADSWACCARDAANSWTVSPTTLATRGRLIDDTIAPIQAAVAFGDDVIAFKEDRAYIGSFVPNDSEVWRWRLLPINRGAMYGDTTGKWRQTILFLSDDNLYMYDGAMLVGLMDERMSHWFRKRNYSSQQFASIAVDELRDLVWVKVTLYVDDSAVLGVDRYVFVCHIPTKRWSSFTAERLQGVFQGPALYPNNYYGTHTRTVTRTVWGVPYTGGADTKPREISAAATANAAARITVNDFGDAFIDTELTRASLKFITAPTGTAPSVTGLSRNTLVGSLETASPVTRSSDGLFDIHQTARWHRLQFDVYGDFELTGYAVESKATGMR